MSKNVAELLVETLVYAGVQRIYGVAGDSVNGIRDAIRTGGLLSWIHVRHEEGAAFAAGVEAHLIQPNLADQGVWVSRAADPNPTASSNGEFTPSLTD